MNQDLTLCTKNLFHLNYSARSRSNDSVFEALTSLTEVLEAVVWAAAGLFDRWWSKSAVPRDSSFSDSVNETEGQLELSSWGLVIEVESMVVASK